MSDEKNLWDHVKQVKQQKEDGYWQSLSNREKSAFNTYMVNRALSMNSGLCPVINELQHLTHEMSDKAVHDLYVDLLPSDSRYYPYVKNNSSKKRISWVLEYMVDHFECSTEEAEEYYDICKQDPEKSKGLVEFVKHMYPLEDKQIKEIEDEFKRD